MNNNQSARSEEPGRPRRILMNLLSVLSKVIPVSFFAIVCFGFWRNFVQTGKRTSLLWMVSEGLVILLLVFCGESSLLSRNPWDLPCGTTFKNVQKWVNDYE